MYKKVLLLSCIFLSGCLATLRDPGLRHINIIVVENKICAQLPKLEQGQQATGILINMYHEEQNDWFEVARINFPQSYVESQVGDCVILPDYKFISGNRYSFWLLTKVVVPYNTKNTDLPPRSYFNSFLYQENYNRITLSP